MIAADPIKRKDFSKILDAISLNKSEIAKIDFFELEFESGLKTV